MAYSDVLNASPVVLSVVLVACGSGNNGGGSVGLQCPNGKYNKGGVCTDVPDSVALGTSQYQSTFRGMDELRGVVQVGTDFFVMGNFWGADNTSATAGSVALGDVATRSFVQKIASDATAGAAVDALSSTLFFEGAAIGKSGTDIFVAGNQWTVSGVQGFVSKLNNTPALVSSVSISATGGAVNLRAMAVGGANIVIGGFTTGTVSAGTLVGKRDGFVCSVPVALGSSSCLQVGTVEDDEVTAVATDGTYAYVALRSNPISSTAGTPVATTGLDTEIFKINLSDMTKTSLVKISGTGDDHVAGLVLNGNVLYAVGVTSSKFVTPSVGGIFAYAYSTSDGGVQSGFPVQFGSTGVDRVESVVWDSSASRLLIAGTTWGDFQATNLQTGAGDGFVAALSATGVLGPTKQIGTVLSDALHAILPLSTSGQLVGVGETAGNVTKPNFGGRDGFWTVFSL